MRGDLSCTFGEVHRNAVSRHRAGSDHRYGVYLRRSAMLQWVSFSLQSGQTIRDFHVQHFVRVRVFGSGDQGQYHFRAFSCEQLMTDALISRPEFAAFGAGVVPHPGIVVAFLGFVHLRELDYGLEFLLTVGFRGSARRDRFIGRERFGKWPARNSSAFLGPGRGITVIVLWGDPTERLEPVSSSVRNG